MTFIGNANNATVVTADVRVCNSVVHVVDRVLLPNATLTAIPIYEGMSEDCKFATLELDCNPNVILLSRGNATITKSVAKVVIGCCFVSNAAGAASGLATRTWTFALTGALAIALMI